MDPLKRKITLTLKTLFWWAIKIHEYHMNGLSATIIDETSVMPPSNITMSNLASSVVLIKEFLGNPNIVHQGKRMKRKISTTYQIYHRE